MARYIDADVLIEEINKITKEFEDKPVIPSVFASIAVIQNQPTAFNMDAVVAELEELKGRYEKKDFAYRGILEKAIDIVRNAGKEGVIEIEKAEAIL